MLEWQLSDIKIITKHMTKKLKFKITNKDVLMHFEAGNDQPMRLELTSDLHELHCLSIKGEVSINNYKEYFQGFLKELKEMENKRDTK
jgi:hypothetical protein